MKVKEVRAEVKASTDADGAGEFTALVSVFGNEDSVGDVVMPGAFADTLTAWKASGNPIPVIWSHDWSDPFSHIGSVDPAKAEETDRGLQVTGQLGMDNAKAAQVFRLMKAGRVTQFSFAYDIEEGAWVEKSDEGGRYDGHYELRKLKLYEVGPTLVGANQETELLAVKAHALEAGVKEGRVLAQKHVDSLKEAHATLGNVIAAAEKADDDTKSSAPPSGAETASGSDASATQNAGQPDDSPANDDGSHAASSAEPEKSAAPAQAAARLQLQIALTEGI